MHHAPILAPWIPLAFFLGVCGAALWKGGRDERIVSAAFLADVIASLALLQYRTGTQWGVFAVDGLFFILLVAVALKSRRYWPIAAAGFQLLAILTHAASTFDPHLGGWAYITAGIIWTDLVTLSLAVGTYNRWRERRQLAAMTADGSVAEPGATRL